VRKGGTEPLPHTGGSMTSKLSHLIGLAALVAVVVSVAAGSAAAQHLSSGSFPQYRPAASFYTPQALKAQGLRMEAMARAYGVDTTAASPSIATADDGFSWSSAFVGALSILGAATVGAGLIVGARHVRRTRVAV
jgi:hypothetical protein